MSDAKRQLQKKARSLKFWLSEKKGAICEAKTEALIKYAVSASLYSHMQNGVWDSESRYFGFESHEFPLLCH